MSTTHNDKTLTVFGIEIYRVTHTSKTEDKAAEKTPLGFGTTASQIERRGSYDLDSLEVNP